MGFTLADEYPAIDPGGPEDLATGTESLYAHCIKNHLRIDNWYGLANHFTNPLTLPGTGKILLSRDTLNDLKLTGSDAFRTLTITDNTQVGFGGAILGNSVKIKKILLTDHEIAVTPGYSNDPNTPYIVSIADPRWLFWDRGKPITKSYNVRDCSGTYYSGTLNGVAAWTWAQLLADLWTQGVLTGLGTQPLLPFTPDGTPENWIFRHDYPLNAIKYLLDRLACGLKYDPVNDTLKIIRLGDTTDASALAGTQLATKYKGRLRVDTYQVTPYVATFPQKLRIEFPVRQEYTDGTPNYTTLDRTVVPAAATFNTAYLSLEDDLTALRPPDAFSNLAALGTRADERQTHWQHKRTNHDTGIYREYGGIFDLTTAIGCYYNAQAWEDRGGERGILTVLTSGKNTDRQIEDWRRRMADPECGVAPGIVPCCPPFLGSDLTDCCDTIGPDPNPKPGPVPGGGVCCPVQLFFSCGQNATGSTLSPSFLFTVCENGSITFDGIGPQFVSNVGYGEAWTINQYCGTLSVASLIPQMLAMVPGGAASYCHDGVTGGSTQQACIDAVTTACNNAWGAGTQEAITCINAGIQRCFNATVKADAPSSGCASCGGGTVSAPMPGGYNVSSSDCHCGANDSTMAGWMAGDGLFGVEAMVDFAVVQAIQFATMLTGESSPAALTGNVNNYAPTLAAVLRITTNGGGPYNITGLAGGAAGYQITIINIHASDSIVLTNQDAASTAANRFICPGGLNVTIIAGAQQIITYDAVTARWRVA